MPVRAFLITLLACLWAGTGAADPVFSAGGPDAAAYGQAQGYPAPTPGMASERLGQQHFVGLHSQYERYRALREVPTSATPSALRRADAPFELRYEHEGRSASLADYLARRPVTGLLIARDDTILYEHYQYGRSDQQRFLSHSMAKTITGLLVGAALDDGAIRSLEDTASVYVPELAGTAYGATPIRALLQMSSGVAFREAYQPGDDITRLVDGLVRPGASGGVNALLPFNARIAEPGAVFNYASADTQVLGLVLSRATGKPLPDYFSQRLWAPLGAEAPAAWDVDAQGEALAFCCVVARLRDWARLGLMIAHDGRWNGRQVVSRAWMYESTTAQRGKNPHYGYQIWLSGEARPFYLLRGVFGQHVLVDPNSRLVLVQTAVNLSPNDGVAHAELMAVWRALMGRFGLR